MRSRPASHSNNTEQKLSPIFFVSAHYLNQENKYRTQCLLKLDAHLYGLKIENLLKDKILGIDISKELVHYQIQPKMVGAISVKRGKKGEPIFIDLNKAPLF